jgi:ribonuclease G
MNRQVILEKTTAGHRGAVLEEGKVQEWLLDDPDAALKEGMIISGKIVNVLSSMDAAFIDIGLPKHGYLHKKEHPVHQRWKLRKEGKEPAIAQMLQTGDRVLVQVKKEAAGSKGPTLTMLLSIAGSYIIYMPFGGYTAISKKLDDDTRDAFREAASSWCAEEEGLIVRTNAGSREAGVLEKEFYHLRRKYEKMLEKFPAAPGTVFDDQSSAASRVERDFLTDEKTIVLTNDAELASDWKQQAFTRQVEWRRETDLFHKEGMDRELEKTLRPFVWMKNGSSLLIEQTEAMTVIDVNSSKFTGRGGSELAGTSLEVNKTAAAEIARQLRLRNIGGIIIIDFIDMPKDHQRREVLQVLKEAAKNDRTITNVIGFTNLGYVEMTRKQSRKTLEQILMKPCEACGGSGRILREEKLAEDMARTVTALKDIEAVLVDAAPRLYRYVQKQTEIFFGDGPAVFLREKEDAGGFLIARTGSIEELQDKGIRLKENN